MVDVTHDRHDRWPFDKLIFGIRRFFRLFKLTVQLLKRQFVLVQFGVAADLALSAPTPAPQNRKRVSLFLRYDVFQIDICDGLDNLLETRLVLHQRFRVRNGYDSTTVPSSITSTPRSVATMAAVSKSKR